jgi:MoaA/NifB/PqqE/SkfB family radical SAM enzyme
VLTQANFGQLEAMLEFCEARGIGFNAQPAIFGRVYFDSAARRAGLNADQIRELHVRLAGWKREGRPVLFSISSYAHAAAWPDYDTPTTASPKRSRCFAGRYYVHIEPDGDVVPCAMHVGVFNARNAVRDGLEQALAHAMVHHCGDCWMPYMNQRKALFAFRPSAVREVISGASRRAPNESRRR